MAGLTSFAQRRRQWWDRATVKEKEHEMKEEKEAARQVCYD